MSSPIFGSTAACSTTAATVKVMAARKTWGLVSLGILTSKVLSSTACMFSLVTLATLINKKAGDRLISMA